MDVFPIWGWFWFWAERASDQQTLLRTSLPSEEKETAQQPPSLRGTTRSGSDSNLARCFCYHTQLAPRITEEGGETILLQRESGRGRARAHGGGSREGCVCVGGGEGGREARREAGRERCQERDVATCERLGPSLATCRARSASNWAAHRLGPARCSAVRLTQGWMGGRALGVDAHVAGAAGAHLTEKALVRPRGVLPPPPPPPPRPA